MTAFAPIASSTQPCAGKQGQGADLGGVGGGSITEASLAFLSIQVSLCPAGFSHRRSERKSEYLFLLEPTLLYTVLAMVSPFCAHTLGSRSQPSCYVAWSLQMITAPLPHAVPRPWLYHYFLLFA